MTVKTAISIEESLLDEANRLSKKLHISRSKLFSLLLKQFAEQERNAQLLQQINKAYEDYPDEDEKKSLEIGEKLYWETVEKEEW